MWILTRFLSSTIASNTSISLLLTCSSVASRTTVPHDLDSIGVNPADFLSAGITKNGDLSSTRVALAIGAVIASAAYSGVVYAIYVSMKRSFMMTVRRLAGTN